ncbi:MAG: hypothetical protein K0Q53_971 [Massilibacillus sp.]|jgi:cupin 2 domain-containing protein|nr:hypothetical protein [Massilibacillus sp.]
MNLFQLPNTLSKEELFETILKNQNLTVERIISTGQKSPTNFYYDQPQDELVFVLQGEAILTFEYNKSKKLIAGDFLLLPAHQKHRVEYTSSNPPCIWLAIHGDLT